tara:strand:+ start:2963 stop:7204 length:4242 start_codon:yes stop_codon:yes gene_type:complete
MPKLNQNFLKGKMNKDLDERLVPKGEYRLAQNILITQSEENDVGAVENIKGNSPGHLFQTGNGWENSPRPYSNDAPFIPSICQQSKTSRSGQVFPFECIGYKEDILNNRVFWFVTNWTGSVETSNSRPVDTLNTIAPKRSNTDCYVCHVLMSDLDDVVEEGGLPRVHRLVTGNFLNFSKNHLITGVNIIDDLLFWTDNYNQPRKINVAKAFAEPKYYDNEEKISVAKFAPYLPIILNNRDGQGHGVTLSDDVNIQSDYLKENFIRFSYRYKYKDGEYSTIAPFTQVVFSPINNGVISNDSLNKYGYEKIFQDTIVESMQNDYNKLELRIPLYSLEKQVEPDTSNDGTFTWINHLDIDKIELLAKQSDQNIVKIIKSIDVNEKFFKDINVDPVVVGNTTENVTGVEYYKVKPDPDNIYVRYAYRYLYKSEEPFKALPEAQITRVYDHVPIRAKSQELVGNRIVYGNYLENHPIPIDSKGNTGINYVISSSNKGDLEYGDTYGFKQNLDVSYRYHSIKQRRNYKVGVVLSDKFGRQSTVILSSNDDHPYLSDTYRVDRFHTSTGMSWSIFDNPDSIGKSLAITFLDDEIVSKEHAYNGDINSKNYNPTGWYSWRLVVQQKEQEYYNVYAVHPAENWNALTDTIDNSASGSSWLTLYGDNINKVPRIVSRDDANKVGSSNSEIRLFPRIIKDATTSSDGYSVYSSFVDPVKVLSIGTAKEQGLVDDDNVNYSFLGSSKKSTQVAELPLLNAQNTPVFETTAVVLQNVPTFTTLNDDSKYVILKNRNYFLRKGHYVEGTNIQDQSVCTLTSYAETINNTSKIRFTSNSPDIYDTYAKVKKDHYINNADTVDPDGQSFRAVIIETQINVIGESNDERELIITLDRNITLALNQLEIMEFTTIKSISDIAMGVVNYQRLELSRQQENVNANDVLTFRIINADPISVSRGLSVFETQPFESNLDIFYETSTSGLISDLNSEAGIEVVNPSNIRLGDNIFYEDQSVSSGNNAIGGLTADSGTDDPNAIFSFNVHSIDSENTDWEPGTPPFTIDGNGILRVIPGFVWNPQVGEELKNFFTITVQAIEATAPGNPSVFGQVEVELKNKTPIISEAPSQVVVSGNENMEGVIIFECRIQNGSVRADLQNRHLKVVLEGNQAGAGFIPVLETQHPPLIDSTHYDFGNTSPDGPNLGMLRHEIVFDEQGAVLRIICNDTFHAGKVFRNDGIFDIVNGVYLGTNDVVSEEDRTIIVKVNDGGIGNSMEPTEWNPDGITVETSFVMNTATVENGQYRIPIYIQGIKENGTEFNYPGYGGGFNPVTGGFDFELDPGVRYVNIGSSTSAPTIDEPCVSLVPGTYCPHTLHENNRFFTNAFGNTHLTPFHTWSSDGNGRIKYLSAIASDGSDVFKVAIVNQDGYIVDIQGY